MRSTTSSQSSARNGSCEPHGDALLHGATDDAPQHVVAPLVAGQHPVHDEEGDAAGVIGHDAQRPRRLLGSNRS